MINRVKTREVKVGDRVIGGAYPVSIQSMTNTRTTDVDATLEQIFSLKNAGCDIVRVTVPDPAAAKAFKEIKDKCPLPIVADIHFQSKLAIASIEAGADKIRINPGNIGSKERVKSVIDAAKASGSAVRIGVNSGSLEKDLLAKYGGPTPEALVESAGRYVRMMEEFAFDQFVVSMKSSTIETTVEACTLFSQKYDYPQHIGITESGTVKTGSIKSSVGLGILLHSGIGDTLRVSLSGDPVEEIYVGKEILKSLGLISGPDIIACPTCGRTRINITSLADDVEKMMAKVDVPIKVAVMGCIVNGPGEAKEADIGVAGGVGEGVIFIHGEEVEKVKEDKLLEVFWNYIQKIVKEKKEKV